MLFMFLLLDIVLMSNSQVLFDFHKESDIDNWNIIDDVVMGGRSSGRFFLNNSGNAVFRGLVSLENNGGFSSVRYRFDPKDIDVYDKIVLRIKGDGKRYQLRIKTDKFDRFSYISYFQTTGVWETIEIPLRSMFPTFRGIRLNKSNYPGKVIEEIGFLVGNKTAEPFQLEIDWIGLL